MYSFCTYAIDDFKRLDKTTWLETMKNAHTKYEQEYPGRTLHEDQIFAWDDCFDVLQRVLKDFQHSEFYIVFEYVLYSENGCRILKMAADQMSCWLVVTKFLFLNLSIKTMLRKKILPRQICMVGLLVPAI